MGLRALAKLLAGWLPPCDRWKRATVWGPALPILYLFSFEKKKFQTIIIIIHLVVMSQ
jgi:hypothetical protein